MAKSLSKFWTLLGIVQNLTEVYQKTKGFHRNSIEFYEIPKSIS